MGVSTPEIFRHPPRRWKTSHVINDFRTSFKRNIRNKITNRWAEMRNPPRTIQDAFKLADDVESQLHLADSFKLELFNNFPLVEVNEISAGETSGNEFEVNEMSRDKKWGNNKNSNYKCSSYNSNHNFNSRPQYNKPQEDRYDLGTKRKRLQDHFGTGVSPLHSHGVQQQLLQTIWPGYEDKEGRIEEAR